MPKKSTGNKAAKNKAHKTTTKPDNNAAKRTGNKVAKGTTPDIAYANVPVEEAWKTWDMAYQDKDGRRNVLSGLWHDFQKNTINEMWLKFGIKVKKKKTKATTAKAIKGNDNAMKAVKKTTTNTMNVTKMKAAIARLGR